MRKQTKRVSRVSLKGNSDSQNSYRTTVPFDTIFSPLKIGAGHQSLLSLAFSRLSLMSSNVSRFLAGSGTVAFSIPDYLTRINIMNCCLFSFYSMLMGNLQLILQIILVNWGNEEMSSVTMRHYRILILCILLVASPI